MPTISLELPPFQELAFPSEWEPTDDDMFADDDALMHGGTGFSPHEVLHQEAGVTNMTVLGPWKEDESLDNDDGLVDNDGDDFMMDVVYRPIGSFLLVADEFFGGSESCESPTGPLEEFHNGSGTNFDHTNKTDDDHEQFLSPMFFQGDKARDDHHDMAMMMAIDDTATTATHNQNDHDSIIGLPFEERYKATLEKLQASMKRSQETRKSLLIKTAKTEKYERLGSVKEILSSIATSSSQVESLYSTAKRQHSI